MIQALESAERAQIITEVPRGRGTALNFAFAHALIPSTLVDQFSGLRRQRLHKNAAEAIEATHPDDYETLGYHFERAGNAPRACTYYLRAGDRALALYANQEAEHYYRTALDLNETGEETPELLSGLGEALFRQSQYGDAGKAWKRAEALYQAAGDKDRQAFLISRQARATWYMGDSAGGLQICRDGMASLGDYMEQRTPGVATLTHETARACYFNYLNDEALPLCQRALDLARSLGLVDVQAETLATLGILPNQPQEAAKQALIQAVEISESAGLLAPAVRAHANLASHLELAGDLLGARDHFMRSRETAQKLGIPDWEHSMLTGVVDISFLLGDLAYIETLFAELKALLKRIPNPGNAILLNRFIQARMHRFKGEWDEALPEMRVCSEEAKQRQLIYLAAGINVLLAELLLEMDRPEEAEPVLLETIQFGKYANEDDQSIAHLLLSAVRTRQSRLEEARQLIEETRVKVNARPFLGSGAFLLWSDARLASAEQNWEQATSFYETLDQMTARLGLPWYRARILADWANVYLQRGEPEDQSRAEEHFDQSIQVFEQLGLSLYVDRMKDSRSKAPHFEFHISRQARDRYQFDETLFSLSGNVLFANFHASRLFTQKMNQKRDLIQFPEQTIRAGQINALGLIDEILHLVIAQYRQQRNPLIIRQALDQLYEQLGKESVDETLKQFTDEFPPVAVYRRQESVDEYLEATSAGTPHSLIALEEMLMLWIANANPACSTYFELFDDANLEKHTAYNKIISSLDEFFATQPFFGPDNQTLTEMLRSPALAVPHSLPGQLEYIRTHWGAFLGQHLYRLLSSLDLIKEEEKIYFAGLGSPPAHVLEFAGLELEAERFSPDQDWMPNLVLIAKNAYVWLDQLSKKYQKSIVHLDEIPDEELDYLAASGITGLWLIGLWERSQASKRIKQLRGNPDAVASAYSLFAYDIAGDLGGEDAYQALRQRAWQRGVRLASDMVPNHMGIDSPWLIEHPDWFISLDYSPFPVYSFNGPDFSWDPRVGIYLEDHYYNNSDAAVVFKRVDRWTGDEKYTYHGNDGTSMPWNDTAQLNYLKPEVREAVIQTILHVARKFPIIRFDAAMTLAKRHFQRLWYPEPGSGGDIPSRAEHGLTKAQFDAAVPVEFWREVVDRVAQEAPGTLLLAEAFWLMEGYFVRSLGMHRVYNSAFMNMLRDERNQEYRLVIKNTLEFDPEILKRYVNFMNNPDERTAVEQFGKGDKYFGICTLLATLPGLPMFGHGQIEGFTEKYGMEYRRAYWDEWPDSYLMERHQREIFPLLRRRYLFAEAYNFLLYDFFTPEGVVNEDVFAYSNRSGDERALVVFHNKYASARGWIRNSVAYLSKAGDGTNGGGRSLVQKTLGEGLGLEDQAGMFTIFRDHVSGLEYIRRNQEICQSGLYVELDAYQYHVFNNFRQVHDDVWGQYNQLNTYLNGRGVPSVQDALRELFLQAVQRPYKEVINPGFLQWLKSESSKVEGWDDLGVQHPVLEDYENRVRALLAGVQTVTGTYTNLDVISHRMRQDAAALIQLNRVASASPGQIPADVRDAFQFVRPSKTRKARLSLENPSVWSGLIAWVTTRRLGEVVDPSESSELSRSWIDEWQLGKTIDETLQALSADQTSGSRVIKLLTSHQELVSAPVIPVDDGETKARLIQLTQSWLKDSELQRYLGFNRYQGVLWFQKEAFDDWLWWAFTSALIDLIASDLKLTDTETLHKVKWLYEVIVRLQKAAVASGYQVEKLLE
jgi:glycosidase/tetratricopeptide (TPR) repeat protein